MYNVGSNPNACAELLAAEPSVWEEAMATLETMQEIIKTKNGGDWIIYYPHQIGAARCTRFGLATRLLKLMNSRFRQIIRLKHVSC